MYFTDDELKLIIKALESFVIEQAYYTDEECAQASNMSARIYRGNFKI